jgi:DNA-binding XRE family transcriptional regulator
MSSLIDLRNELLWTTTDLARQAGLDYSTVAKAEKGEWIVPKTARTLAETLGKALGRDVEASQIEGLNIKGVTKGR